jgi:hypothetical protein
MTITEVMSYKAFPPEYAIPFLRKIRYCVPREAILKEGVCPVGSYLVPFVNRLGQVVAWLPFTTEPNTQGVAYVKLPFPADPSRIYRVLQDGTLETALQQVNEDY